MRLPHRPPNVRDPADEPSVESLASGNTDEVYGRGFRDFIESITVTSKELAAIISMPDFSIQEVKQLLQDGKNSGLRENPFP